MSQAGTHARAPHAATHARNELRYGALWPAHCSTPGARSAAILVSHDPRDLVQMRHPIGAFAVDHMADASKTDQVRLWIARHVPPEDLIV